MPANAQMFADVVNLVGNTITTANGGVHPPPGTTASTQGPSTPASSPSSGKRFHPLTSSVVRRPRGITYQTLTCCLSGLAADRPVLTTPLSLDPRDSFPADASADDSTTSTRPCQEPPAPPPALRSRTTAHTASSSEYVCHFRIQSMLQPGTSPVTRHEHLTSTDTPPGPRHLPPALRRTRESKLQPPSASPTTLRYSPQDHPTLITPVLTTGQQVLFWDLLQSFPNGTLRRSP